MAFLIRTGKNQQIKHKFYFHNPGKLSGVLRFRLSFVEAALGELI